MFLIAARVEEVTEVEAGTPLHRAAGENPDAERPGREIALQSARAYGGAGAVKECTIVSCRGRLDLTSR
ncbi:MAG: hypothetical protein R3B90_17705 [Planctomycetaceae bacterium]